MDEIEDDEEEYKEIPSISIENIDSKLEFQLEEGECPIIMKVVEKLDQYRLQTNTNNLRSIS